MNNMQFYVIFKQLPKPVRYTSIVYMAGIFTYNVVGSYYDSKDFLLKFRQNRLGDLGLSESETRYITTDWDAVRIGAKWNAYGRLWNSIIWPISSISKIVPSVVLALNPPPSTDNTK